MFRAKFVTAAVLNAAFAFVAIFTAVTLTSGQAQQQRPAPANNAPATSAPAAATASAAPAFVPIPGGTYRIDPAHSSINFSVRHMMITDVRGRFTDFSGTIRYDDRDITRSSVEFTARVASINTDVERRDTHLRSADYFDAERYPEMTFRSTRIERRGNEQFVATGDFTLRGVTRQITIPFTLRGAVADPRGARFGIEANTTINRQDFGVAWSRPAPGGGLVVANEVAITLLLEVIKQEAESAPRANQ